MVMIEVNLLVNDLPRYQATLASKVHNLRDALPTAGLLKNASIMLKNLDKELSTQEDRVAPSRERSAVAGPRQNLADTGRSPSARSGRLCSTGRAC